MLFLTREKMAKIVIYDQARVNGGSNYDQWSPWVIQASKFNYLRFSPLTVSYTELEEKEGLLL